jgi:hypothetical protein
MTVHVCSCAAKKNENFHFKTSNKIKLTFMNMKWITKAWWVNSTAYFYNILYAVMEEGFLFFIFNENEQCAKKIYMIWMKCLNSKTHVAHFSLFLTAVSWNHLKFIFFCRKIIMIIMRCDVVKFQSPILPLQSSNSHCIE